MRTGLLAAAMVSLGAVQASAQATSRSFPPSADRCIGVLLRTDTAAGYVSGYFTAMNAARDANVGTRIDLYRLLAEVQKACRERPAMPFVDAVSRAYDSLAGGPKP